MAENTKIEWTDHTFNPWRGCSKVHEGCAHCYAETMSKRNPGTLGIWGPNGTRVVASEAMWKDPLKWNKKAEKTVERPRVFCASLADVFEDWQGQLLHSQGVPMWQMYQSNGHPCDWGAGYVLDDPETGEPLTLNMARRRLFRLIDDTPNLDWLLLTKRPENIRRMLTDYSYHACVTGDCPHEFQSDCDADTAKAYRENVFLGTSISTQEHADKQIPELLKCRDLSPVLFLSIEPLLGPMNLADWFGTHYQDVDDGDSVTGDVAYNHGIDWVIVGGESGPNARPCHPDWVRSIRDQCLAADVLFFFKQWGEWLPFTEANTSYQRVAFGEATKRGQQSYFGARVVPGPQGLKTTTTEGVAPIGYARVGKKAAGRTLDGREWSQFPEVPHA